MCTSSHTGTSASGQCSSDNKLKYSADKRIFSRQNIDMFRGQIVKAFSRQNLKIFSRQNLNICIIIIIKTFSTSCGRGCSFGTGSKQEPHVARSSGLLAIDHFVEFYKDFIYYNNHIARSSVRHLMLSSYICTMMMTLIAGTARKMIL